MNNETKLKSAANKTVVLLTVLYSLLAASELRAAELSGVEFKETYREQGANMMLQGMGLKSMLFFKAFVAGYYADSVNTADQLGEFPKRIEVEYFVSIPGKKLNNYTVEQIKANIDEAQFDLIKDEIKLMAKYFVDLKPGDRFSLTYLPGVGTKFAHNGQVTGMIKGRDFAQALFSVWIGENPFDHQLKQQITGLARVSDRSTGRSASNLN